MRRRRIAIAGLLAAVLLAAHPTPARSQSLAAKVYEDLKSIFTDLVKMEVGNGASSLLADKAPEMCFYLREPMDRLQSGQWGQMGSAFRASLSEFLGDFAFFLFARPDLGDKAPPMKDKLRAALKLKAQYLKFRAYRAQTIYRGIAGDKATAARLKAVEQSRQRHLCAAPTSASGKAYPEGVRSYKGCCGVKRWHKINVRSLLDTHCRQPTPAHAIACALGKTIRAAVNGKSLARTMSLELLAQVVSAGLMEIYAGVAGQKLDQASLAHLQNSVVSWIRKPRRLTDKLAELRKHLQSLKLSLKCQKSGGELWSALLDLKAGADGRDLLKQLVAKRINPFCLRSFGSLTQKLRFYIQLPAPAGIATKLGLGKRSLDPVTLRLDLRGANAARLPSKILGLIQKAITAQTGKLTKRYTRAKRFGDAVARRVASAARCRKANAANPAACSKVSGVTAEILQTCGKQAYPLRCAKTEALARTVAWVTKGVRSSDWLQSVVVALWAKAPGGSAKALMAALKKQLLGGGGLTLSLASAFRSADGRKASTDLAWTKRGIGGPGLSRLRRWLSVLSGFAKEAGLLPKPKDEDQTASKKSCMSLFDGLTRIGVPVKSLLGKSAIGAAFSQPDCFYPPYSSNLVQYVQGLLEPLSKLSGIVWKISSRQTNDKSEPVDLETIVNAADSLCTSLTGSKGYGSKSAAPGHLASLCRPVRVAKKLMGSFQVSRILGFASKRDFRGLVQLLLANALQWATEGKGGQAFGEFVVNLASYVVQGKGGLEETRLAREALRRSAVALLGRQLQTGFPDGGQLHFTTPKDKSLLAKVKDFFKPTLGLRLMWQSGYKNKIGSDGLRYVPTVDWLIPIRWAFSKYAGLQISLLDPLGPVTELALRAEGHYGNGWMVGLDAIRPRLDLWVAFPQITRHVGLVAGVGYRLIKPVQQTDVAGDPVEGEFDYEWSGADGIEFSLGVMIVF